jgi:nitrite reductase/ring-hydroxylating ferredoxin subunit
VLHFEHPELLVVYNQMREHLSRGVPTLADDVYRVPVHTYTDPSRWATEVDRIFHRRPVPIAFTGELRSPGAYRAVTIAGIRVLIVRTAAGEVRAYINACRHRGMPLVADGTGTAKRFTCGYHAWTYAADDGRLLVLPANDSFGEVDKNCLGLRRLAVEERSGLIWVVLTPGVPLDLDAWLGSMAPILDKIGLDQYETLTTGRLDGPNWKIVTEGYLETYHFAALHPNSFLPLIFGNMALIDVFDAHFRLCTPMRSIADHVPPVEGPWSTLQHIQHSFFIFPSLQISFTVVQQGPDPVYMALVSQIFPGDKPESSVTVQRIITSRNVRDTEHEAAALEFARLTFSTVQQEDYSVIPKIQTTLTSTGDSEFLLGRNEIGVQRLHLGLARYLSLQSHFTQRVFNNV